MEHLGFLEDSCERYPQPCSCFRSRQKWRLTSDRLKEKHCIWFPTSTVLSWGHVFLEIGNTLQENVIPARKCCSPASASHFDIERQAKKQKQQPSCNKLQPFRLHWNYKKIQLASILKNEYCEGWLSSVLDFEVMLITWLKNHQKQSKLKTDSFSEKGALNMKCKTPLW